MLLVLLTNAKFVLEKIQTTLKAFFAVLMRCLSIFPLLQWLKTELFVSMAVLEVHFTVLSK